MTKEKLDRLNELAIKAEITDEYRSLYSEFMHDPDNEGECDVCPERFLNASVFVPCGQQRCWVLVHCEQS